MIIIHVHETQLYYRFFARKMDSTFFNQEKIPHDFPRGNVKMNKQDDLNQVQESGTV